MRVSSAFVGLLTLSLAATAAATDRPDITKDVFLQASMEKFAKADVDQDGLLTPVESIHIGVVDTEKTEKNRQFLLSKYDNDRDGRLDSTEQDILLAGYSKIKYKWAGSNSTLKARYARIDLNLDGVIDQAEYKTMSTHYFAKLDKNQDGIVTLNEINARAAIDYSHPWAAAPSQLQ